MTNDKINNEKQDIIQYILCLSFVLLSRSFITANAQLTKRLS